MICLFGGTFDPVHNGHLHAARSVSDKLGNVVVSMVLSARPSHREGPGASMTQRWEMLELACASEPRLEPDAREILRDAPSYTVHTLEALRTAAPAEQLVWVIGSDAFELLTSWYRWQDVPELTNLLVLKRPGYPLTLDAELEALVAARSVKEFGDAPAGELMILDHEMLSVSAREIRAGLAGGRDVDHLLPRAVANYIRRQGLYGVISDPQSAE